MKRDDNKLQSELEERLRFEMLLADISARFVNLPAKAVDSAIEDSQRRICECLGLEFSALWQWTEDTPQLLTLTHLFTPPWGPEHPHGINGLEEFPWTYNKLVNGETLCFSTEELPPEAKRDLDSFRHFGVKSTVVLPFRAGQGPFLGAISFNMLSRERVWPQGMVQRLGLLAQVFTNALERKRFERALMLSEERLSLAADSAQAGLWELNITDQTFWVTERARSIFHYPMDADITMDMVESSVHPDDLPRLRQAIKASITKNEPLLIDYRITTADGVQKWISSSGRPYCNSAGEPERVLGVSIDISERKETERQLRERMQEIEELKKKLEKENLVLLKEIESRDARGNIVGRSPEMQKVLDKVALVAPTDATVLIGGETGVGKELVARAVHRTSARKNKTLFVVNCASLPPTLVESELFGREKGAYTGAMTRMIGRFEAAHEATLFLDEISELPLEMQAKLLRVLEEGSFERLGSSKTVRVDVRIIAASNQDLEQLVNEGKFRKDLFYRLNVFSINVPALRRRTEDIPALIWAFVKQYEEKMGKRIDHIPQSCLERLQRHDWPGNVRELRNLVERAMIVCAGRTLNIELPPDSQGRLGSEAPTLQDTERNHIISVLDQTGWRVSGQGGAAEILGLKRTTLQSKMKKLGIQRPPANA